MNILNFLVILQQDYAEGKVIGELKWRLEDLLPSGSGIDNGTKIDLEKSRANKIVLTFSFHHMDEHGGYCGWSDYKAVLRPGWHGVELEIFGKDKNGILDYLHDTFRHQIVNEELGQAEADELLKIHMGLNKS